MQEGILRFRLKHPQQEKDYALLLSFVGQARLQFAGLHSLFLALWCIYMSQLFACADTLLITDISAIP